MARLPASERRKPLQVPLMYAFRDAHRVKDARKEVKLSDADGERILSERGSVRRRGANEIQLKRNLEIDLINLMNTVDLASCLDLDGHTNVRKSILNYGMSDLTHLTSDVVRSAEVVRSMKDTLLRHEPRLIAESLNVTLRPEFNDVEQKIAFDVSAEMACRPVDIPLEFIAEIDVGSGKVKLSNVTSQG
jgi:type VI secretion system protein ImpF